MSISRNDAERASSMMIGGGAPYVPLYSCIYAPNLQFAVRADGSWFWRKPGRKWQSTSHWKVPMDLLRVGGLARLPNDKGI